MNDDHESILRRLPPNVRALAERELRRSEADGAEEAFVEGEDVEHGVRTAAAAALAPFAAAADEADRVADEEHAWAVFDGDLEPATKGAVARTAFWAQWLAGREAKPEPLTIEMQEWYISGGSDLGRFVITSEAGAAQVLDALLRYFADKPAETLRAVAALVKTLPVGLGPQVCLGSGTPAGFALVAGIPGAHTNRTIAGPTALGPARPMAYVLAEIDGIEFAARYNPEDGQ